MSHSLLPICDHFSVTGTSMRLSFSDFDMDRGTMEKCAKLFGGTYRMVPGRTGDGVIHIDTSQIKRIVSKNDHERFNEYLVRLTIRNSPCPLIDIGYPSDAARDMAIATIEMLIE